MSVALLYNTWDKSERVFPIIEYSMNKYWPDCPYPAYFTTNFIDGPFGTTIKYGEDEGWSKMMLHALKQLPEHVKVIVFMMEDYWLWKKVDQAMMYGMVSLVVSNVVQYMRLIPSPGAIQASNWNNVNLYNSNFMYRTSLGPSVWNRKLLETIIEPEENPWQFEFNSANRVPSGNTLTAVREAVIPIVCEYHGSPWKHEPIEKGNFTEDAFKYLEQEGLKEYAERFRF